MQRHDGPETERVRLRRTGRQRAVQQQAGPHGVQPGSPVAQQRGAVGGVTPPDGETDLRQRRCRRLEPPLLLLEQRRRGLLGGGEVCVDGVEGKIATGEHGGQRRPQVVVPETEPVHAGIDLQVAADPDAAALRYGVQRPRRRRRRHRRREVVLEHAAEVADAERTEYENRYPHAGAAELYAFLDIRAGQHCGAGLLQGAGDDGRAVAVRIGLDDGDDRRWLYAAGRGGNESAHGAIVGL